MGYLGAASLSAREQKLRDSILRKLEVSELTVKSARPTGIGWAKAADAMREVLGTSLALPPRPDVGWIARMSGRIRDLGLTEEDCTTIAREAAKKGRRTESFEWLIKKAPEYLAEAQLAPTSPVPPAPPKTTRPVSMGG